MTTTAPAFTTVHDTTGTEIGAIRTTRDGTHIAARLTTDHTGYIPVGEYTTHDEAHAALTGRILVHATRSTTSPVIGYYEPFHVTDFDPWGDDTNPAEVIATEYRAYLTDGTPAGRPIHWGPRIAPASNQYPTETKARAGIRKAHKHLHGGSR